MAQAGITHDVTLGGVGYMLAQVKGNYVKETLPGREMPSATIETDSESLESPDGFGFSGQVRRVYFEGWRGVGRYFEGFVNHGTREPAGLVAEMRNLRPVMAGGVVLAPAENIVAAGGSASSWAALNFNGQVYVAEDDQVYSVSVDGSANWLGFSSVGVLTANVVSAGYDASGKGWFCCADGTIRRADNPAVSFGATKAADYIAAYAGVTFRAWDYLGNHSLFIDAPAGVLEVFFASSIRALVQHQGALWIGCDDGLYRLTGQLEQANPSTAPGVYDLFRYRLQKIISHSLGVAGSGFHNWQGMVSFADRLWAGVDGKLVAVRVTASGSQYVMEEQRLPVGWPRSLAVGAGLLFALVQSPGATAGVVNTTLWGYDPNFEGWWQLDKNAPNGTYLFSAGAVARNAQLVALNTTEAVSYWSFDPTNPSGQQRYNFSTPGLENWMVLFGGLTLPLITPDELAKAAGLGQGKQGLVKLQRVGLEWDTPRNLVGLEDWPGLEGLIGQIGFGLKLSLDESLSGYYLFNPNGGDLFYPQTGARLYSGRTEWNFSSDQQLIKPVGDVGQPSGAGTDHNGNGWLFQLAVLGGGPGPLIRRMYLDYQVLEFNPVLGSRWKLALALEHSPEVVRLDGQAGDVPDPIDFFGHIYRGADALAFRLWQAWSRGETLEFVDVNGGPAHTVKVVSLKQERTGVGHFPALASEGGKLQSNYLMWVELVEVID